MVRKSIIVLIIVSFAFAVVGEEMQIVKEPVETYKEDSETAQVPQEESKETEPDLQNRNLSAEQKGLACATGCTAEAIYEIAYIWLYLAHRLPVPDKQCYFVYASIPFIIGIGTWIWLQKYSEKRINPPNPEKGKSEWDSKIGKQLTGYYCLGIASLAAFNFIVIVILLYLIAQSLSDAM